MSYNQALWPKLNGYELKIGGIVEVWLDHRWQQGTIYGLRSTDTSVFVNSSRQMSGVTFSGPHRVDRGEVRIPILQMLAEI